MANEVPVRLTVTFSRVKAPPNRPDLASRGGRITEVHASWSSAAVRLAELAEKRTIHHAAVTDLSHADRAYENHQQAVSEGRARG